MQPVVPEHMSHEAQGLKYLFKCRVANAQASGVGAKGRHYRALTVAGEAPPLHGTSACRDASLGMQMAGDFACCPGGLMTKCDWADRHFMGDDPADIGG